jgi:hypothetical protein
MRKFLILLVIIFSSPALAQEPRANEEPTSSLNSAPAIELQPKAPAKIRIQKRNCLDSGYWVDGGGYQHLFMYDRCTGNGGGGRLPYDDGGSYYDRHGSYHDGAGSTYYGGPGTYSYYGD